MQESQNFCFSNTLTCLRWTCLQNRRHGLNKVARFKQGTLFKQDNLLKQGTLVKQGQLQLKNKTLFKQGTMSWRLGYIGYIGYEITTLPAFIFDTLCI